MQKSLAYHTEHQYIHEIDGSFSIRKMKGETKYIPWDGSVSFLGLILPKEAEFRDRARQADKEIEFGHRCVVTHLRLGGDVSAVLIPIEHEKLSALCEISVLEEPKELEEV